MKYQALFFFLKVATKFEKSLPQVLNAIVQQESKITAQVLLISDGNPL